MLLRLDHDRVSQSGSPWSARSKPFRTHTAVAHRVPHVGRIVGPDRQPRLARPSSRSTSPRTWTGRGQATACSCWSNGSRLAPTKYRPAASGWTAPIDGDLNAELAVAQANELQQRVDDDALGRLLETDVWRPTPTFLPVGQIGPARPIPPAPPAHRRRRGAAGAGARGYRRRGPEGAAGGGCRGHDEATMATARAIRAACRSRRAREQAQAIDGVPSCPCWRVQYRATVQHRSGDEGQNGRT